MHPGDYITGIKNSLLKEPSWTFHFKMSYACNPELTLSWLHRLWWQILATKCAGDKFEILVTDLIHWKNDQHNEKVADIMILPPSS